MSKAEEKVTALQVFGDRLRKLGLSELPAAKNVIAEFEKSSTSSSLIEGVRYLIDTALDKQKEKLRTALDEI